MAKRTRARISAGVLMYRRRDGDSPLTLEVLLVHPGGPFFKNKDIGAWSIPKGEITSADEDLFSRAKIEFEEELGIAPPDVSFFPLGSVKQKGGKTVHAWACEGDFTGPARSNTYRCEWPPHSGQWHAFPEVDDAQWFPIETAREKINQAQAEFLDRLLETLSGEDDFRVKT